ncbi:hypothetical protein B1H20_02835 [Streptomyces violaceoruber]|uniref:Uncharacterized protein n=1 Tax=Streptomyces violaceoruber TaxID=1935 RepID=A0A1V0U5R9_STRVN|nr:hypothetical protein B1H20_02835 [Streptomyces violaceoruber]
MLRRPDSPTAGGGRPSRPSGVGFPYEPSPPPVRTAAAYASGEPPAVAVVKSHGVAFENRVRYVSPVPSTTRAAASAPGSAEGSAPAATA